LNAALPTAVGSRPAATAPRQRCIGHGLELPRGHDAASRACEGTAVADVRGHHRGALGAVVQDLEGTEPGGRVAGVGGQAQIHGGHQVGEFVLPPPARHDHPGVSGEGAPEGLVSSPACSNEQQLGFGQGLEQRRQGLQAVPGAEGSHEAQDPRFLVQASQRAAPAAVASLRVHAVGEVMDARGRAALVLRQPAAQPPAHRHHGVGAVDGPALPARGGALVLLALEASTLEELGGVDLQDEGHPEPPRHPRARVGVQAMALDHQIDGWPCRRVLDGSARHAAGGAELAEVGDGAGAAGPACHARGTPRHAGGLVEAAGVLAAGGDDLHPMPQGGEARGDPAHVARGA
jgi:hypothetical protein